jgi:hypothetical protein
LISFVTPVTPYTRETSSNAISLRNWKSTSPLRVTHPSLTWTSMSSHGQQARAHGPEQARGRDAAQRRGAEERAHAGGERRSEAPRARVGWWRRGRAKQRQQREAQRGEGDLAAERGRRAERRSERARERRPGDVGEAVGHRLERVRARHAAPGRARAPA